MSDTLAAKWIELATQALLVLLVPRALGPAAYGEFAVAFAVVSVLSLGLGLGAPLAAVRYLPAAGADERLAQARAVAAEVARSRARVLALLTAAALVLAPTVLDVPPAVVAAVCLAAWCSVGSSVASELGLALARPRVWNARFPLENGLVVVGAIAGHAVSGAHGAIVGMLLACAATFAVLAREVADDLRAAPAGVPLPPEAATYARFQTVTVILGTLVKRGGTLAMPLAGASSAQTGFAAIATGLGAAGAATMMSLLMVQMPGLVPLRREEAEREAAATARAALMVGLAVALPAALLAAPAIELLLGAEFEGARDAVVAALPSVPLGVVLGLASLTAGLRVRPGALAASWALGSVVFIALAAAMIQSLEAEGASIAMSVALLATAVTATLLLGGRTMRASCIASVAGAAVVLAAGTLAA
jgi:O-antigen/teichoic acid export membrane protein